MLLPIVYHPDYACTWPADHRFPMSKFRLLFDYLCAHGLADPARVHTPRPVSDATLHLVHDPAYTAAFRAGTVAPAAWRRVGMHWYPDLVTRTLTEVGGTYAAALLALRHGMACNTAGGTHHAFPGHGAGYCIFNDLAVTATALTLRGHARRILIVDLDVHQGDGTAFIFRDNPRVVTFSMHGAKNFPFRKQQSDRDVPLPDGLDDAGYLALLAEHLPDLLARTAPDLVLYDAGVDVHRDDRLGKLALTDAGLYARDQYVLHRCRAAGVPVAAVVGGGYAADRGDLAPRHAQLFRAARDVWRTFDGAREGGGDRDAAPAGGAPG